MDEHNAHVIWGHHCFSFKKDQKLHNCLDDVNTVTIVWCNLSIGFGEVTCRGHSPRAVGGLSAGAGRGVVMDRRPPAIFVGDALGLDFLNSIATPVDTAIDWIADGEGYLSWLEQAHLVPGDGLRDMRARALPGELDRGRGPGAEPTGMVQRLRAPAQRPPSNARGSCRAAAAQSSPP